MNKDQLKNFIYTADDLVYNNWLATASQEEMELADEIFREAKRPGAIETPEITDVSLASFYLKKFTLKGV